jgi:hypothetical protein
VNPWIEVSIPVVAQIVIAAYVYGQLTQRQKDQGGWLKAHEETLDRHEYHLMNHAGRIAHLEGARALPFGGEDVKR